MKPHIKVTWLMKRCYQCECNSWRGWGNTPVEAYNDWAAYAMYGGTCA